MTLIRVFLFVINMIQLNAYSTLSPSSTNRYTTTSSNIIQPSTSLYKLPIASSSVPEQLETKSNIMQLSTSSYELHMVSSSAPEQLETSNNLSCVMILPTKSVQGINNTRDIINISAALCLPKVTKTSAGKARNPHMRIIITFEYLLRSISYIFVCISLFIMLSLNLPKSLKFFLHKQLLISYVLSDTVLLLSHDDIRYRIAKNRTSCVAFLVINYYTSMCFIACMMTEGIHIWIILKTVFDTTKSQLKKHLFYVFLGWGVPLIITGIVMATSFDAFKRSTTCYNLRPEDKWLWKGPIAALLGLNMTCFISIISIVIKKILSGKNNQGRMEKVMSIFRSMIVIVPLLGFSFILGFFVGLHKVMAYLFVASTSSLGILFFIFHIVFDEQVRLAFTVDVLGRRNIISSAIQSRNSTTLKTKLHVTKLKKNSISPDSTPKKFLSVDNPGYIYEDGIEKDCDHNLVNFQFQEIYPDVLEGAGGIQV